MYGVPENQLRNICGNILCVNPDHWEELNPQKTILQRFEDKILKVGDCWIWQASFDKDGYGKFWFSNETIGAHRAIWELLHGKNSKNMVVCHSCDNPCCVNPDHLFLGTNAVNMADRDSKDRQAKGEKIKLAKLKESQVRQIRQRFDFGKGEVVVCHFQWFFGLSVEAPQVLTCSLQRLVQL